MGGLVFMFDYLKINENLFIFPVLHNSIYFTNILPDIIKYVNPSVIALEIPLWAKENYIKAIKTLPEITVLVYNSRENDEKYYILIEPADIFSLAARIALKEKIKLNFVDSDTISYYEHNDPYYEEFFIEKQNYKSFFDNYKNYPFKKNEQDDLREKTMAYNIQSLLDKNEKVLAITGMSHYSGIIENLNNNNNIISLFSSYKPESKLFSIHPSHLKTLLPDLPVFSYFFELFFRNENVSVSQAAKIKFNKAKFGIVEGLNNNFDLLYEENAKKLYIEFIQTQNFLLSDKIDRRNFLLQIYKYAGEIYSARYKEEFYNWQLLNMIKFSRNISLVRKKVIPDFFTIIEAAKGCVDDNYAWELMHLMEFYPFQPEESILDQIDISEIMNYHSMFIRRSEKIQPKMPLKDRKKMPKKDDWSKKFKKGSICSYQPEDIIIENFADFLKQKAKAQLQSELTKSEPFTTSFFEGIDIKETIRKSDGNIYIKKFDKIKGEIGSLVIIFDEDNLNTKYNYKMTWLGEHEQESDMAFYSTQIGEDLIGPGISRCEYGGLMLSYPNRRMYDVWSDYDYQFFDKKSEKLLIAAIDYSLEKYIVFVAKNPPRSYIYNYANRLKKQVVFLPLGAFSKTTLNKLKIFHILAGHDVREIADKYIF